MVIIIDLDSGEISHSSKPKNRTVPTRELVLPEHTEPELQPVIPEPTQPVIPHWIPSSDLDA